MKFKFSLWKRARTTAVPSFTPSELSVQPLPTLRVALLGTCITELLARTADPTRFHVKHYLMDSSPFNTPPHLPAGAHDAVIVHLTLRTILGALHPQGDGDLFYLRDETPEDIKTRALETLTKTLDGLIAHLPQNIPLFFLAFIEPTDTAQGLIALPSPLSLKLIVQAINQKLAETLALHSHIFYVELNDLLRFYGDSEISDAYITHASHAAFTGNQASKQFCLEIWSRIGGLYRVFQQMDPIKLIITDLDNTLWKNVAAEADEIIPWQFTEGWPLGYAEALLACKARGILLAIASKNDEAVIRDLLPKIWQDRLNLNDFCSFRLNWQPKSQSIAEILAETNLLPESVLFIDDNPLEIAEVKAAYPTMRTLTVPQQRWKHILCYAPETQRKYLSDESVQRTALIHAKIERDKAETSMDRSAFLQSLGLALEVTELTKTTHKNFPRALELLNKTNQFNSTGQRWSEADMAQFFAQNGVILAFNARDRLANHGLIGLALVKTDELVQIVLSCRVFGLGIETAMLNFIQSRAASPLKAQWRETGRNHSCQFLYPEHGWTLNLDTPNCYNAGANAPVWPDWIAH